MPGFKRGRKRLVKAEAEKWGISEIGISENTPYTEQMIQRGNIVDSYTIVGELKGMFQPAAIGFKDAENVSGEGNGIQERERNSIMLPIICLFIIAVTGGKLFIKKFQVKSERR